MEKTKPIPTNRKELQARIRELSLLKREQEMAIQDGIREVRERLRPSRLIGEAAQGLLFGDPESTNAPLMRELVSQVIGLVLPQGLLAKLSGKIGGALLTRGANQLLTNAVVNNREEIGKTIVSAWKQLKHKFSRNGQAVKETAS